jgi:flagellar biosynthesis protein FlhG
MPEIIPIGGGKGGVGKSFIAANAGALIAKRGYRVVLVDLDLGGPNTHTFLGLKNPKGGIDSYLGKTAKTLEQAATPTPFPNLFFIGSNHSSTEIANLYHAQKLKLISGIKALSFDFVILDLGAGTNFNTLDFFLLSDKGIFICTPEPTSIENSFRFIKAAYLRRLKQNIKPNSYQRIIKQADLTPENIVEMALKYDPKREPELRKAISRFQFGFILNQLRTGNATLGKHIETACNRHFYSTFKFLGNISFDDRVSNSIFKKTLFTLQYPDAATSQALDGICETLIHDAGEVGEEQERDETI